MKYGVFSQNEFIYPDTYLQSGRDSIVLNSAKGGICYSQIVLKSNGTVRLKWQGNLAAPECFRILPVYVARNTDLTFNGKNYLLPEGAFASWNTRKAPFWVYEPLEPMSDTLVPSEQLSDAICLKFDTNVTAGEYSGTLTLTDNDGATVIPVSLKVYPVEIPKKETLRHTNWFDVGRMLPHLDCEPFSEAHWEQIKKCGKLMRDARQTDFIVQPNLFIHTTDEQGNNHFDFTHAKRIIEMYLSMGFTHIEGPILFGRENWHCSDILVNIDDQRVSVFSEKGNKYARDFFTAWYEFICENGWKDITLQHVCDEPGEHCLTEYTACSELVRGCMPGITIIEALANPTFAGATDILVPKANRYLEHKEEFDKIKAERDVWFYTCCDPGGEYLNRILDMELIRVRYMHWANYIYGLKGYLHWGFNQYVFSKMFKHCDKSHSGDGPCPAGDTHVAYIKDNKVIGSIRLLAMRAGCEDYELLNILAKKDKALADKMANNVIRSFTDYDKNTENFEDNYKKLLELL